MSYILVINVLKSLSVEIGKLGLIKFRPGLYVYVGSAKKNFSSRIKRHLAKNKKKFWHVDYLLAKKNTIVKKVYFTKRKNECQLARGLVKFPYIKNFGSSDCKCSSHLFYIGKEDKKFYNFLKNNHLNLWRESSWN